MALPPSTSNVPSPLSALPTTAVGSVSVRLLEEIVASPGEVVRYSVPPVGLAESNGAAARVEMAQLELATVLRYWAYRPELWRIVGFTTSADLRAVATPPSVHPIIEVVRARMVVRRQQMGLSENDVIARHTFMTYLSKHSLPVPTLVARGEGAGAGAEGSTWAAVPIVPLTDPQQSAGVQYVIEQAIYEIQEYVPGRRFVTDGPDEETDLVAAAQTLGALHQASFVYTGLPHRWPPERMMAALAQAYLLRMAESGKQGPEQGLGHLSRAVAAGLRRLARAGVRWVEAAEQRLAAQPNLPWLLVHGDYQPHNLAFTPAANANDRVVAIYDFDALHRDWRVVELAYALLAFAGLQWDEQVSAAASALPSVNPPLIAQGLDLDRAGVFLGAYGAVAPPQPGEADLLGDALLLVLPIVFANGVAADLVFVDNAGDGEHPVQPPRERALHLAWAESFPEWVEAHRGALRDAWQHAAGQEIPG